jgi:hypothetical protein
MVWISLVRQAKDWVYTKLGLAISLLDLSYSVIILDNFFTTAAKAEAARDDRSILHKSINYTLKLFYIIFREYAKLHGLSYIAP